MRVNNCLILIIAIFTMACSSTKHVDKSPVQSSSPSNGTSTIWVSSYSGNCSGAGGANNFLLTQEGENQPTENWDCFYQTIEGFTFQAGYICKLKVEQIMVEGLPELKLITVLSKQRNPAYFKIYDIWATTHLNGKVLDISATRPNMEINLSTMKVLGIGMCNQYFGKIESYTRSTIKFGTIAGTEMMCPEIHKERAFLKALSETVTFKIKGQILFLYNSSNTELLRFQKVD